MVVRKACTPSGCPNARVENGDRHRRRSQSPFSTAGCHKADNLMGCRLKNLSWGGGGSLPVVASTDAGSVESREIVRDTELFLQNATASESSEKQCSSSFPYCPGTRDRKRGLAPSAVPVPVFDLVSPFSTRPRRAGIVEFVVVRKACTPSGCPNARVENGDRHRRRSQSPFSTAGCHKADSQLRHQPKNLSWGDQEFAGTPHILDESEPIGYRCHPSG